MLGKSKAIKPIHADLNYTCQFPISVHARNGKKPFVLCTDIGNGQTQHWVVWTKPCAQNVFQSLYLDTVINQQGNQPPLSWVQPKNCVPVSATFVIPEKRTNWG